MMMGRIGQNPMKWDSKIHHPSPTTITSVVFIPFLDGYWSEGLDVLKLSLESLLRNTPRPFDLMVFDNGSCPEVQEYLLDSYNANQIQFLILSQHNVGKVGAWNFLFSAAPGEVIAFSDSDVLFLPGWLEASLEILEAFPEAGMITAHPARRGQPQFCSATLSGARNDPTVEMKSGDLIPREHIRAYAAGYGRTVEEVESIVENEPDVILKSSETSAFVSASHTQFLTTRKLLNRLLPFKVTMPLGPEDDHQMDAGVNDGGHWRLSTTKYLVHHLGNTVPQQIPGLEEIALDDLMGGRSKPVQGSIGGGRLLGNRYARQALRRLNTLTFKLLYQRD